MRTVNASGQVTLIHTIPPCSSSGPYLDDSLFPLSRLLSFLTSPHAPPPQPCLEQRGLLFPNCPKQIFVRHGYTLL